jgi:hypothetical protein
MTKFEDFVENYETPEEMFESYCEKYGYKYNFIKPTIKMKRNGNIIFLRPSLAGMVDRIKLKNYKLIWKYKTKTKNGFIKYTRPQLLKDGKIVATNITRIKNILLESGEIDENTFDKSL